MAGGAHRPGLRQCQPRLRAAAAPRADRARPDRRRPLPAAGADVVAVRGGHARDDGASGSAGTSPSTTSSCGTRSRTSTSSPSPSRRSPSRASRTSRARATRASRWAATCCSSRTSRRASASAASATPSGRAWPIPGRTSSSSTTPPSATMTCPARPRNFIHAELRYDHASGFWFAPGRGDRAEGLLRQQRQHGAHAGLHPVQREGRLRLQAVEPRGLLRGAEPHRQALRLGRQRGRRQPATTSSRATGGRFYGSVAWRWK